MATREATPAGQPTRRLDVYAGIDLGTMDDLPHDLRVSKKLDIATKEREALDMSAVDVTSKFLRVIWKHAHEEICDRVKQIDQFTQSHVIITVTVPVVWPADARKRLYQAFQSSNILGPNVRLARKFVTEAVATGIAIISTPLDHQGNLQNSVFQVGDTVIISDCGGGTTDLISHQLVSIQPFALREISPGKCVFAWGALLDEAFLDLVRDKAKRQCSSQTYGALTDKDFHEDEIDGVFNPVIDQIINLVKSEMTLHLVMAGGLRLNQYLQGKMKFMAEDASSAVKAIKGQF
ncbi:hypothetical protein FACUT_7230 [Fusarium acutatum]|uniref:Uncharacterized protein n=1 Tax=Fusarium acutatum TaxID=78861 RepID=A0A8H4JPN1_9HYPO|nr:hypothetical protein FACUT_7230 [Fusarium acutatum]